MNLLQWFETPPLKRRAAIATQPIVGTREAMMIVEDLILFGMEFHIERRDEIDGQSRDVYNITVWDHDTDTLTQVSSLAMQKVEQAQR